MNSKIENLDQTHTEVVDNRDIMVGVKMILRAGSGVLIGDRLRYSIMIKNHLKAEGTPIDLVDNDGNKYRATYTSDNELFITKYVYLNGLLHRIYYCLVSEDHKAVNSYRTIVLKNDPALRKKCP